MARFKHLRAACALAICALIGGADGSTRLHAAEIYGLTSGNALIRFDSATPGTITTIGTISGATLVDLDFFPANGLLYGMDAAGTAYRINTTTGAATNATPVLAGPPTLTGSVTNFDFNPAADRVRVFTSGGANQNYRVQPDFASAPQTVTSPGGVTVDGNFSGSAGYVPQSQAYTNNFDNPPSTFLWSVGSSTGSPNSLFGHTTAGGDPTGSFNFVTPVGTGLGITLGSNVGFDIDSTGVAFLSNDNSLFTVDLTTGLATSLGTVGGSGLVSIAAVVPVPVPEPGVIGLGVFAAACGLFGWKRRKA